MLRIRLILIGVVVMSVMSALASASASAITPVFLVCLEKSGSGRKFEDRNCSKESGSGKFELVEVTEFLQYTGTGGVSTLVSLLLKAEIRITCKRTLLIGEIGPKGLTKGELKYDECSVGNKTETFANCEVPNIDFTFIDQLIENSKGEVEDEYKPATGKVFVEIAIKNKEGKVCAEKGTFPVEGTQNAEVEQPSLGAKLLREWTFKASGSHLTFNKEPATYESKASIDLNNDDSWGVSIS